MSYIYGRNPVIESLKSDNPPQKIFLSFNSQGSAINTIYKLAKDRKVQVVKWDKGKFTSLERDIKIDPKSSQGVIALSTPENLILPEQLIADSLAEENPVIVVLDEIKDVHNLGAIARSAHAAGAYGIIVPERNSAPISPASVKISAGVLSHIPVAVAPNLKQSLEYAKQEGFWVVGTKMKADKLYSDNLYDRPICLVIGGEEKGMRPSVESKCDTTVSIPLKNGVESLNASVAAAIILFEIARQRNI